MWLACRTDPDAPRHKGISILIVDTVPPGLLVDADHTVDGAHHINSIYHDDVRVPAACGWARRTAGGG